MYSTHKDQMNKGFELQSKIHWAKYRSYNKVEELKLFTFYRYENNYDLGHDGARGNSIIHQIVLSSNLCIAVCVILGRSGHFRNCICSKGV